MDKVRIKVTGEHERHGNCPYHCDVIGGHVREPDPRTRHAE